MNELLLTLFIYKIYGLLNLQIAFIIVFYNLKILISEKGWPTDIKNIFIPKWFPVREGLQNNHLFFSLAEGGNKNPEEGNNDKNSRNPEPSVRDCKKEGSSKIKLLPSWSTKTAIFKKIPILFRFYISRMIINNPLRGGGHAYINIYITYFYILIILSLYLYLNNYLQSITTFYPPIYAGETFSLFEFFKVNSIGGEGEYGLPEVSNPLFSAPLADLIVGVSAGQELKISSFSIPFLFLLHTINCLTMILYHYNNNSATVGNGILALHYNKKSISFDEGRKGEKKLKEKGRLFILLLLSLQIILFIFFTCTDLITFYITFECSMIPLFSLIFIFGKRKERINAAYYLFFYTLIGSISFLIGIGYLIINEGTSSLIALNFMSLSPEIQIKAFLFFFLPFAVKLPMIPFHLWLPEAHVEASTEGSVLLAALLLKISGYGIIKILFKLFPIGCIYFKPLIMALGLISILLISFSIFRQLDLKKIIAYTSILHMNLALLGLFTFNIEGFYGGYSLMIVHGFVSSGLFILIGYLYNRHHTRALFYYSGLNIHLPRWSLMFFLFTLANCSFPFTGAFIPEMLIFLSLFKNSITIGYMTLIGGFLIVVSSFLTYLRLTTGINGKALASQNTGPGEKRSATLTANRDITEKEFELTFGLMFFISIGFFCPKIFFNIPLIKVLSLLYCLNI